MKVAVRPDEALEARISEALELHKAAKSAAARKQRWKEFAALLAQRSPMTVKRMEREKGLDKRATFVPRNGKGIDP